MKDPVCGREIGDKGEITIHNGNCTEFVVYDADGLLKRTQNNF